MAPPSVVDRAGRTPLLEAIEPLVARLLAKKPDERFASARDFIVAAREVLDARPAGAVTAAPPSVGRSSRAIDPQLLQAIWGAITLGAPAYNAGDHARCAEIYRATAAAALAPGRAPVLGLAERARLEVALDEAARSESPTLAAWALRNAFDELSTVAPVAVPPARDAVDVEIDAFQALVARTYALGHAASVAPLYRRFVALLRPWVEAVPARVVELPFLDRTREAAQAGDAPALVSNALERLRAPFAPSGAHHLGTGPTAIGPPAAALPSAARQAILRAIQVGVPAYNAGDHEGCAREYLRAADAVVDACRRSPDTVRIAGWLASIVERARQVSAHDAAWQVRHAFDAMLSLP